MINTKPARMLLIDAGNTRVKWVCLAENEPDFPAQIEAGLSHQDLPLLFEHLGGSKITSAFISNVAGEALQDQIEHQIKLLSPHISIERFRSSKACAGIVNQYQTPTQLGSDRFASLIAAHHLFPHQPVLIATGGTATTVDAVTADGHFIGGMILPGLKVMADSLAKNTAQLPEIRSLTQRDSAFAKNTQDAIQSGCIHAQVGAILSALEQLASITGQAPQLLLSGGAAPYLLPYLLRLCPLQTQHIENCVLRGLQLVAKSRLGIPIDTNKAKSPC
ncbi:MAG: type III pantothenate kinase [Undibacterium sp.]|nr:type III pantothenate kinase [Undibacterium sp.]